MEVLIVIGVVLLVAVGFWFAYQAQKKRRLAFQAFASNHGMQYAPQDPFHLLGLPFRVLRRGDGRELENVIWGPYKGRDVKLFDYSYYEESTDSEGRTSRTWYRFNCVLLQFNAVFPHLEVAPEGFFSRFADAVGLNDIELESGEFNRAYNVKAKDRQFAYAFLDARLMEWLLWLHGHAKGYSFEVEGGMLLGYRKRVKPEELGTLLETTHALRERVPRAAWSMYGGESEIGAPVADNVPGRPAEGQAGEPAG